MPHIREFMAEHHIASSHQLLQIFEDELIHHVKSLNKVPVVWQGLLDIGALNASKSQGSSQCDHLIIHSI